MNRNALLWSLVVFFGASVLFGSLRRLTDDSSTAVAVGVQVAALALLVAAIVVFVRRTR